MRGCGADGKLDASRYTEPMPWIGAYVAAATLYCAGAMALDAYSGFRRRKFWFPTKYFSLNSTTLTMVAIATKFPVDLNTSMPRAVDQLTKLSGTVLICTVTANFMHSLGDESQIASNVVSVGILVITVVVNIGIQMGTGVIFAFLPEHVIAMILMLVVLVLMVSSALHLATTKNLLEEQYLAKHRQAESAAEAAAGNLFDNKLKVYVKRHWLMAYTCNPQYVLGRSATCIASGPFCLVGALVLLQALLRCFLGGPGGLRFCSGASDYGWSTTLVLATQVAAVIIGTVAPVYRWLYAVNFSSIYRKDWTCADEFTVEKYWVQRLKDLKEVPLTIESAGKLLKRTAHYLNIYISICIMALLMRLQVGVVLASKFVRLLSVVPVHWLQEGGRRMLKRTPESPPVLDDNDLKGYVLHLEGEDDLVSLMTLNTIWEHKDTDTWMQKGRDKRPEALVTLLRDHSTFREGFRHAGDFDSWPLVSSLLPKEPPNCWSLPLVTLTAVAAALPGTPRDVVHLLLRGVEEGLQLVMLVEENLDEMGLVNMRRAAQSVWRGLMLDKKWLDRDLRSLAPAGDGAGGKKVAVAAQAIAKQEVTDAVKKLGNSTYVLAWPERVMAGNCMYRVCDTIIKDYEVGRHQTDSNLYVWLRTTISDILGACLTNLPRALYMKSFSHKVEEREKRVREAALVLGEAEKILEIVGHPAVPSRSPRETQYLDNWKKMPRALGQLERAALGPSQLLPMDMAVERLRAADDHLRHTGRQGRRVGARRVEEILKRISPTEVT